MPSILADVFSILGKSVTLICALKVIKVCMVCRLIGFIVFIQI